MRRNRPSGRDGTGWHGLVVCSQNPTFNKQFVRSSEECGAGRKPQLLYRRVGRSQSSRMGRVRQELEKTWHLDMELDCWREAGT